MTAVTAPREATASPPTAVEEERTPDWLSVRLATFAALAAFATGHWVALIADTPVAAGAGALAVAVAGAVVLALLGRARLPGPARALLAALALLATLAGGFIVMGLEARLLWPGNAGELFDELDRGLAGIQEVSWPYAGDDDSVRLAILLGAPLMLGLAAGLAFWPARRGAGILRAGGLVALLLLYGSAVVNEEPTVPLLRGLLLLLLVAAWLWLPRLAPREALAGGVVVLAAGLVAVPVASGLDSDEPWWDYRSWQWFGGEADVTFDWDHSYGPLNWSRDGKTLLNVKADRPAYLKAETLDFFDGVRWMRSSRGGESRAAAEIPVLRDRWQRRIRITVRSLRTDFVVGAGTPTSVVGAGTVATAADGTVTQLDKPLEKGDSYTVRANVPQPRPAELRRADAPGAAAFDDVYPSVAAQYTQVSLPGQGSVSVPPEGLEGFIPGGRSEAQRRLRGSSYARVYRLARRLTASAPTTFDAVRSTETYLERRLRYSEDPPARRLPLDAFLFRDRRGYCQQFSGAMALMLRMSGIPARVVSGFSPGSYDADKREYRVRDLDAHSWVEVYYPGIGWVTYDPTPPVAPAQSQVTSFDLPGGAERDVGQSSSRSDSPAPSERSSDPTAGGGGGDGGSGGRTAAIAIAAAIALFAIGAALLRARRHAALEPATLTEARLMELRHALPRLGWAVAPGATLLSLERRLRGAQRPAAARYVGGLRSQRFGEGHGPREDERRAMRRELAGGGGRFGRLRALSALPPGGPRRRFIGP